MVDYAEWPENEAEPQKERNIDQELAGTNAVLGTENSKMRVKISNLTTSVRTLACQNLELLRLLTEATLAGDPESKDGPQRWVWVQFGRKPEDDVGQVMQEDAADDLAALDITLMRTRRPRSLGPS